MVEIEVSISTEARKCRWSAPKEDKEKKGKKEDWVARIKEAAKEGGFGVMVWY